MPPLSAKLSAEEAERARVAFEGGPPSRVREWQARLGRPVTGHAGFDDFAALDEAELVGTGRKPSPLHAELRAAPDPEPREVGA